MLATLPDDKSIAVLPFVNMSSDAEQEYFSDGISEELLNLLAKIPELRVIARTSSFAFKGEKHEIPEIARRLQVAHILEGSVRKSGNKVRITAQLVRASDSTHLWSETYDRELNDIFAVQDEIAGAVVSQLKLTLLGEAPRAKVANPKAYALFLQARQLGRQFTAAGWEQSNTLYHQVLAIDPGYAAAWDGLSTNLINQAATGLLPIDTAYGQARDYVQKELALDPQYALAHDNLAWIALAYDRDLAAAARHFEHALNYEPTNLDIIGHTGVLAQSLGRMDQAIAIGEYQTARDPVNIVAHNNLGEDYVRAGHLDAGIATFRTVLSLSPGFINASCMIGVALLLKGDKEAALAAMQQETGETQRLFGLALAHHALGHGSESDAALGELITKHGNDAPYPIAIILAWRGEADRAFEWLDKAAAAHDPNLVQISVEPLLASIHQDLRWLPLLKKLGLAPEQLAAIPFEVNVL